MQIHGKFPKNNIKARFWTEVSLQCSCDQAKQSLLIDVGVPAVGGFNWASNFDDVPESCFLEGVWKPSKWTPISKEVVGTNICGHFLMEGPKTVGSAVVHSGIALVSLPNS
jgi:hypothetical protein